MKHSANDDRDRSAAGGQMRSQAQAWSVAMNFVFFVAGAATIGWALQRWVWPAAAPWLTVGALVAGVVAGGIRFVQEAMRMNR
jgi:F0F1-type ATP synthase assembly protein I